VKMFSSAPGPQRDETAGTLGATLRPAGAWLFGKIPAHGDFISRGLDHATHVLLDDWLSVEVARARARFADFDTRYVQAPPWYFVDVDSAGAWSGGALCLSVDKVGRRFPILVAASATSAETAREVALAALELVFTTFGEGWDADQLALALGSIVADRASGPVPTQSVWAIEAEDGTRIEMTGRFPDGLIERMLEVAA
jgi:type VI secretion system ImpM family protein